MASNTKSRSQYSVHHMVTMILYFKASVKATVNSSQDDYRPDVGESHSAMNVSTLGCLKVFNLLTADLIIDIVGSPRLFEGQK